MTQVRVRVEKSSTAALIHVVKNIRQLRSWQMMVDHLPLISILNLKNARGQSGKGANLVLFGGVWDCVAGGQTGRGCLLASPSSP